MQGQKERRAFPRQILNRAARIRLHDNDSVRGALVKNLSEGGILLWLDQPMEKGRMLDIVVEPETELAAPLHLQVRVLRCSRLAPGEGSFAVACQIEGVLS